MKTRLQNVARMAICLLVMLVFLTLSGAAFACSVADPDNMGCTDGETFNSFTCRCEKKDMSEEELMCKLSVEKLETFLVRQPNTCSADAECDGYYYRLGPDATKAIVLPKAITTESFNVQLIEHQARVRRGCENEWKQLPAEPLPFKAECRNNVCVDSLAN